MIVRALRGPGDRAELNRALDLAQTWLKEQQSDPLMLILANFLLAAALHDHKCGGLQRGRDRAIHKVFKAARFQCMSLAINRPIYLLALAILTQSAGQTAQSLRLFAQAAEHACNNGFFGVQLATVLDIT